MVSTVEFFAVFLVFFGSFTAAAESLEFITTNSRLPEARMGHTTVYDEHDSIYMLGGRNVNGYTVSAVYKYSLSSGVVGISGTFTRVTSGAAVIANNGTSTDIIFFGGLLDSMTPTRTANVYRIPTEQGGRWEIVGQLPFAIADHSAVYDHASEAAYIFGGTTTGSERHDEILRYDARNHQIVVVARMPARVAYVSAVWNARRHLAYLFGGYSGQERQIVQYDPTANVATVIDAELPSEGTTSGLAVWASVTNEAYILNGLGPTLMRFNDANQETDILAPIGSPLKITGAGLVYVPDEGEAGGGRLYMFGGNEFNGVASYATNKIRYMDIPGGGDPEPEPTTEEALPNTTEPPLYTTNATQSPSPGGPDCSDGATRIVPHPSCCESFIVCQAGQGTRFECQGNTQFNPSTLQCQDPSIVQCGLKYGSDY